MKEHNRNSDHEACFRALHGAIAIISQIRQAMSHGAINRSYDSEGRRRKRAPTGQTASAVVIMQTQLPRWIDPVGC